MKYLYAYKTSDGKRHEDSMDAASREQVFAALRKQGIKAIKVTAADGSKANGEIRGIRKRVAALIALFAALSGGVLIVVGLLVRENLNDPRRSYSEDERRALDRLAVQADGIRHSLDAKFRALQPDRMLDCRAIAATNDVSHLLRIAQRGQALIAAARDETKALFAAAANALPADGPAVREVKESYGVRMSELDALEISFSNRRFALALLDQYRDKWTLQDGKAVFSDPSFAQTYEYCLEGLQTDAATSRWQRDFDVPQAQGR